MPEVNGGIPDEEEATETVEVTIPEGESDSPIVESDTTVIAAPPDVSDKAAIAIAKEQTKQTAIEADTQVKLSQLDSKTRLEIERLIEDGMNKRTQMEKEAIETTAAADVAETAIKEDADPEQLHWFYRPLFSRRKKTT